MSTAFVFAGQGAQYVGMGKDLAEKYQVCKELFERADDALGFSLSKICFEGPIEELTKSNNCQPAIFVASAACLAALNIEADSLSPAGLAGLSLGEWTALYAAGALSFEDALRVLEARGRFMQEACMEKEGGMVSVMGLALEKLQQICATAGVEIANINSPEQIVLSGEKRAVLEAEKLAKEAGAKKTIVLNVAGAFHSKLMAPAAAKLEKFLSEVKISAPRISVAANTTGQPHGSPEQIKREMVRQVTASVQWVSCIEWFKSKGVNKYIELGPGKVLSGLIKRIDSSANIVNIQDVASLSKAVEFLKT